MKRFITILSALLALHLSLNAGNVVREDKFPSIAGISVGDNFDVKIVDGPAVTVKMTLEDVLADYVHLSLVDGILNIDYDEKSLSKEIRAAISRREPKSIMMDVQISIPSSCPFDSLNLFKNATLTSAASFGTGKEFSVNVRDNAVIRSLAVNASQVTLTLSKHADVKASVSSAKTIVKTEGNSSCELNVGGARADIECAGASTVKIHSSADAIFVNASSSSKLSVDGTAGSLSVIGKNSSLTDASSLDVRTACVNASSASCLLNVREKLSITLAGGAKLYFTGAPEIEIVKVEKSSIYKKEPEQSSQEQEAK